MSGPRVRLRPFEARDADAVVRRLDDREVWLNLTDQIAHPYTRAHADAWIEQCAAQTPTQHFAIDRDGEAIGAAGFDRLGDLARLIAEVGYWLGRDCWGQGYATEALGLLAGHALAEFDFVRLQAHVLAWNPASARVLEKNGFAREATFERGAVKDGRVLDSWLYVRLR